MGEETNVPPQDNGKSEAFPKLSDVEIGRLLQENADLKTRIKELEADKQYFKQQIDFHLQRQTVAGSTVAPAPIPAQPGGTPFYPGMPNHPHMAYPTANDAGYRAGSSVDNPPARPKKPRTEFVPRKISSTDPEELLLLESPDVLEPPVLDPQMRLRIRQLALVIVALGIVGALVIWIQSGFNFPFAKDSKPGDDVEIGLVLPEVPQAEGGLKSDFEQSLARMNSRQLMNELRNLSVDPRDDFTVKLDKYDKWLKIADVLLQTNLDEQDRQLAVRYKLNSMIGQEISKAEQDIFDADGAQALLDYSLENLDSDNRMIAQLAGKGETLARVWLFLEQSDQESRSDLFASALTCFNSFAHENQDDTAVAQQLYGILKTVELHGQPAESAAFHHAFWQAYRDHQDVATAALAEQARLSMGNSTVGYIDLAELSPARRSAAIDELLLQLRTPSSGLSGKQNSEAIIGIALQTANDLLRMSMVEEADAILQVVRTSKTARSKTTNQKIQLLENRISLFHEAFDLGAMQDVDDNPARFTVNGARHRILCLVSQDVYDTARPLIEELAQTLGPHLESSDAELVLVYLHAGDNPVAVADVKRFARTNNNFEVWFLNVNQEDAQKVLQSFPMDALPATVVLNREDRVVMLDPTSNLIESLMFESIQEASRE